MHAAWQALRGNLALARRASQRLEGADDARGLTGLLFGAQEAARELETSWATADGQRRKALELVAALRQVVDDQRHTIRSLQGRGPPASASASSPQRREDPDRSDQLDDVGRSIGTGSSPGSSTAGTSHRTQGRPGRPTSQSQSPRSFPPVTTDTDTETVGIQTELTLQGVASMEERAAGLVPDSLVKTELELQADMQAQILAQQEHIASLEADLKNESEARQIQESMNRVLKNRAERSEHEVLSLRQGLSQQQGRTESLQRVIDSLESIVAKQQDLIQASAPPLSSHARGTGSRSSRSHLTQDRGGDDNLGLLPGDEEEGREGDVEERHRHHHHLDCEEEGDPG